MKNTKTALDNLNDQLLHHTVIQINKAYDFGGDMLDAGFEDLASEAFDIYEALLENGSKLHSMSYNQLEDLATETRMFGWDRC